MNPDSNPTLAARLANETYLRQRQNPQVGDGDYLMLADLLRWVEKFAAQAEGSLFDYGCGGAPYRALFGRCQNYVRADVTPGPGIDRVLRADGLTGESADAYDLVLSSQVLEHVQDPAAYVRECWRILKPGGRLLLTTHGMFQEHGCPDDFHRWTSRGLEKLLTAHGFAVVESCKLTVEIRGAIQLLHHLVAHLRCPERPVWHRSFAVVRRLHRWLGVPVLNLLGRAFASQGIVPAGDRHTVYIGVAVCAQKVARPDK